MGMRKVGADAADQVSQCNLACNIAQPTAANVSDVHPNPTQFRGEAGIWMRRERDDSECSSVRMEWASVLDDYPLCSGYAEVVDDENDTHDSALAHQCGPSSGLQQPDTKPSTQRHIAAEQNCRRCDGNGGISAGAAYHKLRDQ